MLTEGPGGDWVGGQSLLKQGVQWGFADSPTFTQRSPCRTPALTVASQAGEHLFPLLVSGLRVNSIPGCAFPRGLTTHPFPWAVPQTPPLYLVLCFPWTYFPKGVFKILPENLEEKFYFHPMMLLPLINLSWPGHFIKWNWSTSPLRIPWLIRQPGIKNIPKRQCICIKTYIPGAKHFVIITNKYFWIS